MAIAVMRKLRLAAISSDRDKILNALQKTGAVEIKPLFDKENTHRPQADADALFARLERAERALEELEATSRRFAKESKLEYSPCKDGFEISYDDFISADEKRGEAEELIEKIEALQEERKEAQAELAKVRRDALAAKPYAEIDEPFYEFGSTKHVKIQLGAMPKNKLAETEAALGDMAALSVSGAGDTVAVAVAAHMSFAEKAEEILRGALFSVCPFRTEARTGREFNRALLERENDLNEKIKAGERAEYELAAQIRALKVYCDRLAFECEKAAEAGKMLATERTFLLEAYVPEGSEALVESALKEVADSAYVSFLDVEKDETPPTLMRNNGVVKNFEAITNLYSPPNARELDPSTIMAFFYSLFLGFIMGDMGYGLLMALGGGILWYRGRKRDGGLKRLAAVFCIGGVFAFVWGILFNSLFGISVLPFHVMPDLLQTEGGNSNWTFLGIPIPALLVIALELGVVQLFAGYVCRAVQAWRRGLVWDGILDGVVWALFSVGVGLAVAGFVEEFHAKILVYVGGGTAGGTLLVAMLTAGRKEKLLGKFTKGFGAAYGVINYASDILSYARLYGLMLSGAVIAQIVSDYALVGRDGGVGMIMSGNVGLIILGVVLMVAGHALNLALGLLGAYIHDARLQYVEFYGRFYEGEGALFTPLGSKHAHVWIPTAPLPVPQKKKRGADIGRDEGKKRESVPVAN